MNPIAYARNRYYRLSDLIADRKRLLQTRDTLRSIEAFRLFVMTTGLVAEQVRELMDVARRYGVNVVDASKLRGQDLMGVLERAYAAHQEAGVGLTLVPVDCDSAGSTDVCQEGVKLLVLPPAKRYFKKMARQMSPTAVQRERQRYDALESTAAGFDIILNEGESPAQSFCTLVHKLQSMIRLRQMRNSEYPSETQRILCFVIWGHGLKCREQLIGAIGKAYNILTTVEKRFRDIKQLTREMYIEEVLKIGHHIVKKNRHLEEYARQAVLVVVEKRGDNVSFECSGHGRAGNVCATFDQHFKQTLRDRYNPRKASGERTEYHVMHGAETAFQVDNILRIFELPPLVKWVPCGNDTE